MKTTLIYTYHNAEGPQSDMVTLDLNLHQLRKPLVNHNGETKMFLPLRDLIDVEHIIKEETGRSNVMVESIRRIYEPSEKDVTLKKGDKVFIDEFDNEIVPNYGEILNIEGIYCDVLNPYGQTYLKVRLKKCKILG